jgi:hypothetical protein
MTDKIRFLDDAAEFYLSTWDWPANHATGSYGFLAKEKNVEKSDSTATTFSAFFDKPYGFITSPSIYHICSDALLPLSLVCGIVSSSYIALPRVSNSSYRCILSYTTTLSLSSNFNPIKNTFPFSVWSPGNPEPSSFYSLVTNEHSRSATSALNINGSLQ